jgi:hypothetical protein
MVRPYTAAGSNYYRRRAFRSATGDFSVRAISAVSTVKYVEHGELSLSPKIAM